MYMQVRLRLTWSPQVALYMTI